MTLDDLKKIFLSPTLFRLDTILSPRLVPVLYASGLTALLLWSVIHLFSTFGRTFGDGLWGLLEIAVFGLFGLVVLRMARKSISVACASHSLAMDHVQRHDAVWVCRRVEIARRWMEAHPPAPVMDGSNNPA